MFDTIYFLVVITSERLSPHLTSVRLPSCPFMFFMICDNWLIIQCTRLTESSTLGDSSGIRGLKISFLNDLNLSNIFVFLMGDG